MQKLKNNEELIPLLKEAGISVKEYANPSSIGVPGTFIMGTSSAGRGILIRNTPAANIKVATDPDKKQAVLSVMEKPLDVKRRVKTTIASKAEDYTYRNKLINAFPVYIPGARFWVGAINSKSRTSDGKRILEADVRAKIGRNRTTTFLIGMDETSHFISVLPKEVKSVQEAHQILKPADLPSVQDIKRQGEFFFVPVSDEVVKVFLEVSKGKEIRRSVPLEKDSNHIAQYAIPVSISKSRLGHFRMTMSQSERYPKGVHFVKGLIFDKRGYRHAPLDLGDQWYQVMRNKELRPPKAVARRYD